VNTLSIYTGPERFGKKNRATEAGKWRI